MIYVAELRPVTVDGEEVPPPRIPIDRHIPLKQLDDNRSREALHLAFKGLGPQGHGETLDEVSNRVMGRIKSLRHGIVGGCWRGKKVEVHDHHWRNATGVIAVMVQNGHGSQLIYGLPNEFLRV